LASYCFIASDEAIDLDKLAQGYFLAMVASQAPDANQEAFEAYLTF